MGEIGWQSLAVRQIQTVSIQKDLTAKCTIDKYTKKMTFITYNYEMCLCILQQHYSPNCYNNKAN